MKILNEDDILNQDFRVMLIKEIEADENISRKNASLKRYEILKDQIKRFIVKMLLEEYDTATVKEMLGRVAPINIFKRTIGKKARVYKTKPKRKAADNSSQDDIDALAELINIDTSMKKANKYIEAFNNCDVFVLPYREHGEEKYYYEVKPMPPHMYDVLEDEENPTKVRAYILSHFDNNSQTAYTEDPAGHSDQAKQTNAFKNGNGKKGTIADSGADNDEPEKHYIFWGRKYHFTFDSKGNILVDKSPEDLINPIGELPAVSFAKDRDISFWAKGGEDLIDGAILINTLLTDLYFNAKMQGSGLFYYFGKGVPNSITIGPNRCITHDIEGDDPTPVVGYASPSPMLAEQMSAIEQFVALLLTTNDLGVNAVSSSLGAASATSGVHELIQNSEPMNSVEDDQQQFRDKEFKVMQLAAKWHNLYLESNSLTDDLTKIGGFGEIDYSIKFGYVQPFVSEKEKVEIIKSKLDIGLLDELGAIMEDNPDLDEDEAIELLKKRKENELELRNEAIKEMNADQQSEDNLPDESGERVVEDKESEGKDEA